MNMNFTEDEYMCMSSPEIYTNKPALNSTIEKAEKITNKRLRSMVFDKYELITHCKILKQYLFLGQGDTIQYLMDLVYLIYKYTYTYTYTYTCT